MVTPYLARAEAFRLGHASVRPRRRARFEPAPPDDLPGLDVASVPAGAAATPSDLDVDAGPRSTPDPDLAPADRTVLGSVTVGDPAPTGPRPAPEPGPGPARDRGPDARTDVASAARTAPRPAPGAGTPAPGPSPILEERAPTADVGPEAEGSTRFGSGARLDDGPRSGDGARPEDGARLDDSPRTVPGPTADGPALDPPRPAPGPGRAAGRDPHDAVPGAPGRGTDRPAGWTVRNAATRTPPGTASTGAVPGVGARTAAGATDDVHPTGTSGTGAAKSGAPTSGAPADGVPTSGAATTEAPTAAVEAEPPAAGAVGAITALTTPPRRRAAEDPDRPAPGREAPTPGAPEVIAPAGTGGDDVVADLPRGGRAARRVRADVPPLVDHGSEAPTPSGHATAGPSETLHVTVRIDRLEVRAPQPAAPVPAVRPDAPTPTRLEDYLRGRSG